MFENYLNELWQILLELSPALLAGLLLAGVMRVFLPDGLVRAHLSQPSLGSAVRAALIGVPMPLCSCGVVPTAIGLRNQGASQGATTSFLISTPQTGVDSVLVSAAFLGWPFAIFKLLAAFFTGVLGGVLVNRLTDEEEAGKDPKSEQGEHWQSTDNRLLAVVKYALYDVLAAIDLWLLVGILLAAGISAAIPMDYFATVSWTQGLAGMLLVLVVSLPLYVCTTASVPIAASLIAAGMPLGTALVFLMAGPATNIATMGAVYRVLGARVLGLYLGTVILASIGLGLGFDFILGGAADTAMHHDHTSGYWWQSAAALILIALMLYLLGRRARRRLFPKTSNTEESDLDITLKVEGMSCQHCVASVKTALENEDQVEQATPDLGSGLVYIKGDNLDRASLGEVVTKAGYKVVDPG